MTLIDGKKIKEENMTFLKQKIDNLEEKLGLAVIQIGHNPASDIYINQKKKLSAELGYNFKHINLEENTTTEEVINIIKKLNKDDKIDGIFLQLPIPRHLDTIRIQNAIEGVKDIDGLTYENIGKLVNKEEGLIPCTPAGIIELLDYYKIEITGQNVVIVGRSNLVGKPLAHLLINRNATVTICHSHTKNLAEITKTADILIVAIGKEEYITSKYIKDGAIVIDVGINRNQSGKIVGDVDFKSVSKKASYITPVPGGVGPMTVYEVGKNVYQAHILRKR